jgi:hypothetical protein
MKIFTPFAGRSLWLELPLVLSIRFTAGTAVRTRFVLAVLALGACLTGRAQLSGVDVINSTYTSSVSWWGHGSFFGDPDVSGSNSVVSASPTGNDYVNQNPSIITGPNYTTVWGEANAGLFQSYAFSNTSQGQYMSSFCDVSAISDISFAALLSQTATLNLQFTGYDNWDQSDCLVSLKDVTSGQTLWQYGWTAFTGAPGTPQFINLPQTDMDDSLTLAVPTPFVRGDTYEVVMDTDAESNNDNGGAQVQLFGDISLSFVPEPSPFALLSLAAMLLLFRRVPRPSLSRVTFRPGRW